MFFALIDLPSLRGLIDISLKSMHRLPFEFKVRVEEVLQCTISKVPPSTTIAFSVPARNGLRMPRSNKKVPNAIKA